MRDPYACHHVEGGHISRQELMRQLRSIRGCTVQYAVLIRSSTGGWLERIDKKTYMALIIDVVELSADTYRLDLLSDQGCVVDPLVGNSNDMAYLLTGGTVSSGPNMALDRYGEVRRFKVDL